jgi:GNAT superfamily N-acetyltransferase
VRDVFAARGVLEYSAMMTITSRLTTPLLARFVLASDLEYPNDDGQDGRLSCWLRGEGQWAVAHFDGQPAGIVCVVTLDDTAYCGERCLYWLEVLPSFRGQGVGRALLRWAASQAEDELLVIKAVPSARLFYRRCLGHLIEPTPNTFLHVKGGGVDQHGDHVAA